MNKTELIQELCRYHTEINEMIDRLKNIMGDCVESPIMNTMFNLFNHSQELTEQLVGDEGEWINWFIYENDCGYKGFNVRLSNWEDWEPVRSVEDLVYVIEQDKERQ